MTDIAALERRVLALEAAQNDTTQTQRWVVAKLGQMSAVQEQHSLRLERIEADVGHLKADVGDIKTDVRGVKADMVEVKADIREIKADLRGLRADLPGMIAETMREVLKEYRSR
jgi:chromosome segregation ATPase